MKFRVKHVEGLGYFAQVKHFLFWYKICSFISGFGLAHQNDPEHPCKTYKDALDRASQYKYWVECKNGKATYTEIG